MDFVIGFATLLLLEIPARTFQQAAFGTPLTSKKLLIDTAWKVVVLCAYMCLYIYIYSIQ